MTTWNDAKGREWTARIDLGKAKAMRDNLGIDIMDGTKAAGLAGLLPQRELLGDALWLVHEPAATSRRIDRDGFYAGLDGDALASGFWGLAAAAADFSEPATRPAILKVIELEVVAMAEVAKALAAKLESAETEAEVEAAVAAEVATFG